MNNWYNSENIWKRRLVSYYGVLKWYLYHKPLKIMGMAVGVIFSKLPISFSLQLKESLRLTTDMPFLSLGVKVVVDRTKDWGRAQFCSKERLTCEWVKKYYKRGDVIYDIGANIGAVSLISALYLKKDCKIYSFEPLPSTFSMLFKNIMINNCDKVIVPLNIALSDKVEINQFHLTSIESGTSGHSIEKNNVIGGGDQNLTVFTQTLDNLVDCYHIEKANHIKIDVDGVDYKVLLGGEKNILNNSNLKTILIERNGKEEQIKTLLKKYNFSEVELKDPRGVYENMGFVRRS